jgi:hypothetical protein
MTESRTGDILAFNALAKFNLLGDIFPTLTDNSVSFRIPSFQLIPGFETLCLFIIGLSYENPDDTSWFYFKSTPLRSGKGFNRGQTVDISEAFAQFLRYHLGYELRYIEDPDPLCLLTHPAVAALSDRSDTLLENLIRIPPLSAGWCESVLTDPGAVQEIRDLLFRAHDRCGQSSSLFAVDGIPFGPEILCPMVRVPGASSALGVRKAWPRHWKVLKWLAGDENAPYITVNWFICSCNGRMCLCILRAGRLIQLADGFQESFELREYGCEFFDPPMERRLYVVAHSVVQLSRNGLQVDRTDRPPMAGSCRSSLPRRRVARGI